MEKTYKNKDGKIAGHWNGTGTYTKNVIRSKHLMKMCAGYGIDKKILDDLTELGCVLIIINEMDTGNSFRVSFDDFIRYSFAKDFGFGEQFFIGGGHLKNLKDGQ
jgi:hypothetical protein